MKNDLTCEVVRDLLPSYVDGLTNDVSNQAVEQHMKTCENCRKLYREMREPMNGDEVSEINNEQKANFKVPSEIDYLKKIRKKNRMRILAAVLTVVIAAGGTYFEMVLMELVANARYLLMSCSLSQKFSSETGLLHRLLVGFDVTDEIFGVAVSEPGKLNPFYNYGMMTVAIPGWSLGTFSVLLWVISCLPTL